MMKSKYALVVVVCTLGVTSLVATVFAAGNEREGDRRPLYVRFNEAREELDVLKETVRTLEARVIVLEANDKRQEGMIRSVAINPAAAKEAALLAQQQDNLARQSELAAEMRRQGLLKRKADIRSEYSRRSSELNSVKDPITQLNMSRELERWYEAEMRRLKEEEKGGE